MAIDLRGAGLALPELFRIVPVGNVLADTNRRRHGDRRGPHWRIFYKSPNKVK